MRVNACQCVSCDALCSALYSVTNLEGAGCRCRGRVGACGPHRFGWHGLKDSACRSDSFKMKDLPQVGDVLLMAGCAAGRACGVCTSTFTSAKGAQYVTMDMASGVHAFVTTISQNTTNVTSLVRQRKARGVLRAWQEDVKRRRHAAILIQRAVLRHLYRPGGRMETALARRFRSNARTSVVLLDNS